MRRLRFVATIVLFSGLVGCGGDGLKRVPVQGTITAQGRPLAGAVIQFIPTGSTKGEGGIGRSDQDGNFTLIGSRAGDKGVVAGEYRVRVSRMVERDGTVLGPDWKQADNPNALESVPAPYSSIDSPLTATVPETGGALPLDIPKKILGRK
jgi:hypothetical protein